MEEKIKQLIARLEAIAKLNKDEFLYSMEFSVGCTNHFFRFVCTERANRHTFISGDGGTIEEALKDVEDQIEEACEEWDYKLPKKG